MAGIGSGLVRAFAVLAIAVACGDANTSAPPFPPPPKAAADSFIALRGRATTPDGTPLVGATVRAEEVLPVAGLVTPPRSPIEAAVKADGSYELRLTPGDWAVECSADGAVRVPMGTVSVPEVEAFDVVLRHGPVFEGKLVDDVDGKPLAGVKVHAMGLGHVLAEPVTRADGTFSFDLHREHVAVTEFQIDVPGRCPHPDGFAMGCVSEWFTAGDVVKLDEFRAQRGNTLRGVVTGPSGPVAGAKVTMTCSMPAPGEGGSDETTRATTTDASGAYEFAGIEDDGCDVRIEARGLAKAPADDDESSGAWHVSLPGLWPQPTEIGRLDVALVALEEPVRGAVSGRVVDGAGEPVAGAGVSAGFLRDHVETTSGPDGRFTLTGVPTRDGATPVVAARKGFADTRLDAAAGDDIEIVLRPDPVVHGRVLDTNGAGVAGAWVQVVFVDHQEARAVPKGPPSPYPGLITWKPGEIWFAGGPAIDGVATDAEGRYSLPFHRFDRGHALVAWRKGSAAAWLALPTEDARGDVETNFVVATLHDLTGRVVRAGTGDPVAGLAVAEVVGPENIGDDEEAPIKCCRILATTAADGSFRIGRIGAGKRKIRAFATNWLPVTAEIEVPLVAAVRLEVDPSLTLAGRLAFEDGTSPEGVDVDAYLQTRDESGAWIDAPDGDAPTVDSHADGRFAVHGLRPGRYRVDLGGGRPRIVFARIEHDLRSDADLKVPVVLGATIEGRIENGRGEPVYANTTRQAKVTATPSDGEEGPDDCDWVRATDEGAFRIGGLDHGLYDLSVEAPGFRPLERKGVRPGAEKLVIVLDPGLAISGRVFDVDGKQLRGMTIVAIPEDEEVAKTEPQHDDDPDATGAFRITGLTPGLWRLRFFKPDGTTFDGKLRLPVDSVFEAGAEDVELHCEAVEPKDK